MKHTLLYIIFGFLMALGHLQAQSIDGNTEPLLSDPRPNPAIANTRVNYNVGNVSNATLRMYDMVGKQVKSVSLNQFRGEVFLDVSVLHPGMYFCTIEADGKTLATKRLVVKD